MKWLSTQRKDLFWDLDGRDCLYHDRFPLSGSFTTFGQRTDPKLTDGIKEITNANYSKRLDLGNEPEFKEIATLFNEMAERLAEYRNSSLEDILQGKKNI